MTFTRHQHRSLGFSLTEVLGTIVVLGIFAALAAPGFLSWVNSKRVEDVSRQVEGALREAQAAAIRKSQQCTIMISTSSITANPTNCLPTGTRDLTQVGGGIGTSAVILIAENNTDIQFSPKGSTSSSNVFVFYHPDQSQGMRCLAISSGIGIIRTGEFRGSHPPSPNPNLEADCHTST